MEYNAIEENHISQADYESDVEITKLQKNLMDHTMSDRGRNWFGTDMNGSDAKAFADLVEKGLATVESAPEWSGDDVIYSLTPAGIARQKKL